MQAKPQKKKRTGGPRGKNVQMEGADHMRMVEDWERRPENLNILDQTTDEFIGMTANPEFYRKIPGVLIHKLLDHRRRAAGLHDPLRPDRRVGGRCGLPRHGGDPHRPLLAPLARRRPEDAEKGAQLRLLGLCGPRPGGTVQSHDVRLHPSPAAGEPDQHHRTLFLPRDHRGPLPRRVGADAL